MKLTLKILFLIPVVAIFCLLPFYLIDPSFDVKIIDKTNSEIKITANFVVNYIGEISISNSDKVIHKSSGQFIQPQNIKLASNLKSGDKIEVTCFLQYDRFVASGIKVTKSVIIH